MFEKKKCFSRLTRITQIVLFAVPSAAIVWYLTEYRINVRLKM